MLQRNEYGRMAVWISSYNDVSCLLERWISGSEKDHNIGLTFNSHESALRPTNTTQSSLNAGSSSTSSANSGAKGSKLLKRSLKLCSSLHTLLVPSTVLSLLSLNRKNSWRSKLVGCFFLQRLLIGCAGLVDRITKGDVLVGPDVAKRLAMGLSCSNPLKLRPVSMSDIASKTSKYICQKERFRQYHTCWFFLFFLDFVFHCVRYPSVIMPRQLPSSWLRWCSSETLSDWAVELLEFSEHSIWDLLRDRFDSFYTFLIHFPRPCLCQYHVFLYPTHSLALCWGVGQRNIGLSFYYITILYKIFVIYSAFHSVTVSHHFHVVSSWPSLR